MRSETETGAGENLALHRAIDPEARALLLRGLIAALPRSGWWTREERDPWFQLLHFLIDWLIITEV